MKRVNHHYLKVGCLALVVMVSALSVVYAKHQSRKYFVELQQLENHRDQLNTEWGQLQLEQGTLTRPGRIEQVARSRLGMVMPGYDEIVIVKR